VAGEAEGCAGGNVGAALAAGVGTDGRSAPYRRLIGTHLPPSHGSKSPNCSGLSRARAIAASRPS
jgi:hypothetical protein